MLYLGGGVVSASAGADILRLAELRRLPVATTLMGLGGFPETHSFPSACWACTAPSRRNAVHECDLLIAVGARFDDRVTGKLQVRASSAKIIHSDIDPSEIDKNVRSTCPHRGATPGTFRRTGQGTRGPSDARRTRVARASRSARTEYPLSYKSPRTAPFRRSTWCRRSKRVTDHDAVVCTDVGQHQMWARSTTSTCSAGSSSAPAASAPWASACRPPSGARSAPRQDGRRRQRRRRLPDDHAGMATGVNFDVPVIVCILNNGYLGMVRQWQDLVLEQALQLHLHRGAAGLQLLAEASARWACASPTRDQVRETALRDAIAAERPVIIDFQGSRGGERVPHGARRLGDYGG